VFDYPTIGGLAEYLVGQLPDAEPTETQPQEPEPAPAAAESPIAVAISAPGSRFGLDSDRGAEMEENSD
ncbi:hypothetical protein, partial [Mycolicibacterium austroafricanum]